MPTPQTTPAPKGLDEAVETCLLFIEKLCFIQVSQAGASATATLKDRRPEAARQVLDIVAKQITPASHPLLHVAIKQTLESDRRSKALQACLDAIGTSNLGSFGTPDYDRFLVETIKTSGVGLSDPTPFALVRDRYKSVKEQTVADAIAAIEVDGEASPAPAASNGFAPLGQIDLDRQIAATIDLSIQKATKGKVASLSRLVDQLTAAEREVIRLEREGRAATPRTDTLQPAGSGRRVRRVAADVFSDAVMSSNDLKALQFEITAYEWPEGQANIPAIRHEYRYDIKTLATTLYAIENKLNAAMIGPPGCGKSTMAEQIAARMNRPFFRIPIDGEMRRREMIGGIKQIATPTGPEMRWFDGALVQALKLPSIISFDEFDRMDPDLAYLLNQTLEGKGLTLLEDENRFVEPHPDAAFIATANTKGVADAMNRFNMVNELSEATRDRIPFWIDVDYMDADEETKTLVSLGFGITNQEAAQLTRFAALMRAGYKQGRIRTACSFRQVEQTARFGVFSKSMPRAVEQVMISRAATNEDEAIIREYAQQVYGNTLKATGSKK